MCSRKPRCTSTDQLLALAIVAAVVVIRVVSVPIFTYVPLSPSPRRIRERDPYPPWQYPTVYRVGRVSAARFRSQPPSRCRPTCPQRDVIVFVTFVVILVSLIGPVVTLPGLVRLIGIEDDGGAERQDAKARIKAAEAALARIEEIAEEGWATTTRWSAPEVSTDSGRTGSVRG